MDKKEATLETVAELIQLARGLIVNPTLARDAKIHGRHEVAEHHRGVCVGAEVRALPLMGWDAQDLKAQQAQLWLASARREGRCAFAGLSACQIAVGSAAGTWGSAPH